MVVHTPARGKMNEMTDDTVSHQKDGGGDTFRVTSRLGQNHNSWQQRISSLKQKSDWLLGEATLALLTPVFIMVLLCTTLTEKLRDPEILTFILSQQ